MEKAFDVQILTPSQKLFAGEATEVVLPAYDGEVGVLAGHADFVGVLGTGPLKIVTEGNDYWFMLSSGVYQIASGKLTILAELGEAPRADVDMKSLGESVKELETKLADFKSFSPEEYPVRKAEYERMKARMEIHRRTELVN